MTGSRSAPRAWPMLLGGMIAYLAWDLATWGWHIARDRAVPLPDYLFRMQDMPVLIGLAFGLASLIPLDRRLDTWPPAIPSRWTMAAAILVVVVLARLGRDLVFHGYSPSRDEVMVELAGAYLANGRIGLPIPPEWLSHARAMMPEFYSPYGAGQTWTSIYLPVHAAIRALFVRLGDADLAAPAMLGVGLVALWDVARSLFPTRADARAVTMIMAITSVQLLTTAMTPYAMTSHFALDMVWLALILRGGAVAGGLAAAVLSLAAGLHQWHFPILFAGPFILWLFWRRRWALALGQTGAVVVAVALWATLWPMLLAHLLGPPLGGAARGAPEVDDKMYSLFDRLSKWQPLLNVARLMAWNNMLLLPLSALSLAGLPHMVVRLVRRPRSAAWLREPSILLPLWGVIL
ncbi:MAG: MFS transporter, partial [Sphingobium sp.]